MGVSIHFRGGGSVPEKTVDHIISQLKDKYIREGYSDETNTEKGAAVPEKYFWTDETDLDDNDRMYMESQKESEEKKGMQQTVDMFNREGDTKTADHYKKKAFEDEQKGLYLPDTFFGAKSKSICLNPHPKSETFCVRFIKDNGKDEWRHPREFTKTQYVPQPGVHIEICDYLKDVKRKMEAAGAKLQIEDEGGYCDYREPEGDRNKIIENVEENRKVIESVGGMIKDAGWGKDQVEVRPYISKESPEVPEGVPTGTLDDWTNLEGVDLLISVIPKTRVRTRSRAVIQQMWKT